MAESPPPRIVLLGLKNSGKSSFLKKVAGEAITHIAPTQGFDIKVADVHGKYTCKISVWDLEGQRHIRPYWRNYWNNADAIIFMVDSADHPRRIDVAADELGQVLEDTDLAGVPLLVYANKQDLPNAR